MIGYVWQPGSWHQAFKRGQEVLYIWLGVFRKRVVVIATRSSWQPEGLKFL